MAYVISEGYGGWQNAANQSRQMQVDEFYRAIQANRQAAEAAQRNYWSMVQAREEQAHRAQSRAAQERQLAENRRQFDASLGYNFAALAGQQAKEVQKEAEYAKRLAEQQKARDFSYIDESVRKGYVGSAGDLDSLYERSGNLDTKDFDALMTALANVQKERKEDYETGAATVAEQLTKDAETRLADAKAALDAAKKRTVGEGAILGMFGLSEKERTAGITAAQKALADQFKVLSDETMKSPAYRKQVLPDITNQRFLPAQPPPSTLDALWYIGADRGGQAPPPPPAPAPAPALPWEAPPPGTPPPAVTPPGASSTVVAPSGLDDAKDKAILQVMADYKLERLTREQAKARHAAILAAKTPQMALAIGSVTPKVPPMPMM